MQKRQVTRSELIGRLRKDVERLGSQKALAEEIGISQAYLSRVLIDKADPGPGISRHYGLRSYRVFVTDEPTAAK